MELDPDVQQNTIIDESPIYDSGEAEAESIVRHASESAIKNKNPLTANERAEDTDTQPEYYELPKDIGVKYVTSKGEVVQALNEIKDSLFNPTKKMTDYGVSYPSRANYTTPMLQYGVPEYNPKQPPCELEQRVLAVDTEWKPDTTGKADLLQTATTTRVYLFPLTKLIELAADWQPLVELFEDKRVVKLGYGIATDVAKLRDTIHEFKNIKMVESYDLQRHERVFRNLEILPIHRYARCSSTAPIHKLKGLGKLVNDTLGRGPLDKEQQTSNWEGDLNPSQKLYGARDAYCLIEIYPIFKDLESKHSLPIDEYLLKAIPYNPSESRKENGNQQKSKNKKDGNESKKTFLKKRLEEIYRVFQHLGVYVDIETGGDRLDIDYSQSNDSKTGQRTDNTKECGPRIEIFVSQSRITLAAGGLCELEHENGAECFTISAESEIYTQVRQIISHFRLKIRRDGFLSRCQGCNAGNERLKSLTRTQTRDMWEANQDPSSNGADKSKQLSEGIDYKTARLSNGNSLNFTIMEVFPERLYSFYCCLVCGFVMYDDTKYRDSVYHCLNRSPTAAGNTA